MASSNAKPSVSSWLSGGLHPTLNSSTAWELLEKFLTDLQQENELIEQLKLILTTVLEATPAEVVYLCSLHPGQSVEMVGNAELPAQWARNLACEVAQQNEHHEGEIILSNCKNLSVYPRPESVAMVQFSRSRKAWLVAVSLSKRNRLTNQDVKLIRLARRMLMQQHQQVKTHQSLKETLFGLVRCLTSSLDARDPYTWGHSERVARIGTRLGQEMGLSESELNDLYLGGLLHDIGKIGVPDDVLRKPDQLTDEERALIEQHPVIGDEIIAHCSQLTHLRPAIRSHHERIDGRGYPDRLLGEEIPLIARILAVADACDAMMSDRPYRRGMPTQEIDHILNDGAGQQWDTGVIEAFLRCRSELYAIFQRGLGDSVARAVEHAIQNAAQTSSGEFSAHNLTHS